MLVYLDLPFAKRKLVDIPAGTQCWRVAHSAVTVRRPLSFTAGDIFDPTAQVTEYIDTYLPTGEYTISGIPIWREGGLVYEPWR